MVDKKSASQLRKTHFKCQKYIIFQRKGHDYFTFALPNAINATYKMPRSHTRISYILPDISLRFIELKLHYYSTSCHLNQKKDNFLFVFLSKQSSIFAITALVFFRVQNNMSKKVGLKCAVGQPVCNPWQNSHQFFS